MKRITMVLACGLAWAAASAAVAQEAEAPASAPEVQRDVVLLVAPARYNAMQVAFDVARRYSTVLVSYQGTDPDPKLHVWTGYEWLPLPAGDYRNGSFLQAWPARTVLLGGDDLLPASLKDVSAWCPETTQIDDLETAGIVNGIGRYLPFTPSDWRWFAGRYNLSLVDRNSSLAEAAKKESWYDGTAPVEDPKPGFFKYFTRSRRTPRGKGAQKAAPETIHPVEVLPGESATEIH